MECFTRTSTFSSHNCVRYVVAACKVVSERYADICGACDPDGAQCTQEQPTSTLPTSMPTSFETSSPTVAATAPTGSPITPITPAAPCGCFACDDGVLDNIARGFSCLQRIEYLQSAAGGLFPELEACRIVADQFPDNVCGPACHPTRCSTLAPTTSPTLPPPERCSCYDCNQTVLNLTVAGFT